MEFGGAFGWARGRLLAFDDVDVGVTSVPDGVPPMMMLSLFGAPGTRKHRPTRKSVDLLALAGAVALTSRWLPRDT